MSSDREDGEERREPSAAEETEAPRSADEVEEGSDRGSAGAEEQLDAPEGPITLDRYLSRRRPPIKPAWVQIFSLVAMITALVLILIYKDRCAGSVSDFMGTMGPEGGKAGSGSGQHIPVRYQQDQPKP